MILFCRWLGSELVLGIFLWKRKFLFLSSENSERRKAELFIFVFSLFVFLAAIVPPSPTLAATRNSHICLKIEICYICSAKQQVNICEDFLLQCLFWHWSLFENGIGHSDQNSNGSSRIPFVVSQVGCPFLFGKLITYEYVQRKRFKFSHYGIGRRY